MSSVIDAHVHLWNRATDPQPWIEADTMQPIDRDFDADDLAQMLRETQVNRAVLVQSTNNAGETERLLQLASETEAIAGVVGWVDLTADVPAQLESIEPALRRHLVGVRHLAHIDPDENWLDREDVGRGLDALGEAGLVFDLVIRWWQLPLAADVVGRHPNTVFVLDHLGGVPQNRAELAEWETGLRQLATAQNTAAKLSGISGLTSGGDVDADDLDGVIAAAFDAFGAERLMYGSDWPLVELAAGAVSWRTSVDRILDSLPTHERDAVLGSTAAHHYRLDRS